MKLAIKSFTICLIVLIACLSAKRKISHHHRHETSAAPKLHEKCKPSLIDPCEWGMLCHPEKLECLRKPTEKCGSNLDCYSGNCVGDKCKDKTFGMECRYTPVGFGECAYPELNCDESIKKCLKNPDQPCGTDSECVNGKKCVEYFNGKKCESFAMNAMTGIVNANTKFDGYVNGLLGNSKPKPKKYKRFYRK